ncbi:pilus assembly protein TadG-related protein [Streptomyces sp. NPDC002514]|uniref:pilus assembly protein TadG-related protein n=1 Tax=Streptomyces sp. NPDC001270 TaxID=3364554 RepID=UPI0036831394
MTRRRRRGDAGQAFPIYLTVVAGLLFLAFAYLAVGQAGVNRNGAQTAADAAALAAAQNTRDQLAGAWVKDVLDPATWQDIFDGRVALNPSCWRAEQLAAQNDATLRNCDAPDPLTYDVEVRTDKPVGRSVVPGTENVRSTASAKAVIEPLCTFELPGDAATGAADAVPPRLTCEGHRDWELNPDDPLDLPGPEDLFDVHLAD